ncbi:isochorismatase hydrolase [Phanerochaete sordida]|uniref:Isochorismatase hydrolase n=1 Tax=Phanerochaete sordida TaxID=48140 RepID=A0A9P3LLP9_9APHY|nr:isochorismatase hydrolase [Phanerochaete sordida]
MMAHIVCVAALIISVICASARAFTYDRLDKTDSMLLICDIEEGLYSVVHDQSPLTFRAKFLAHAAIGKMFDLPAVIAAVGTRGPNGPLVPEILALLPNATVIERPGEISPWDNPAIKSAIAATGKKQAIIAGIVTDVCVTSLALGLLQDGYSVFVHSDASGAFDVRSASDAKDRLRGAGVSVLSTFAVALELMRDWRSSPGQRELLPFFDEYLPQYGFLARNHDAAIRDGTLSGLNTTMWHL